MQRRMRGYLLNILFLIQAVYHGTEASKLDYGYECPKDPFSPWLCAQIAYVMNAYAREAITGVYLPKKTVKVAFLVHNAGNISEQYFRLLSYILSGLHEYYSDQYGVHYCTGICVFSGKVQWKMPVQVASRPDQINVSSYINRNDKSNGTRIDLGFQAVEEELYRFAYRVTIAPNVCILLTTSPPDNTSLATAAAESLKNSGVNVVVIAVGEGVDEDAMEDLATSTKLVFTTNRLMSNTDGDLKLLAAEVSSNFSRIWMHAQVLPKYTWCYEAAISIVIIVDVSDEYFKTLTHLRDFVVEFNSDYSAIRIMMINSPIDDDYFLKFVHSIQLDTRHVEFEIYDSAYKLRSSMISAQQNLLRLHEMKEKILILATDKRVDNIDDIIVESRACQESGIHVMALGVGTDVLENQLSQIITDPRGITTVTSLKDFTFGLRKLFRTLCPAAVCHKGWVYYDGMCFLYQPEDESWLASQKVCGELQARLVSITTPQKYAWLKTEIVDKYNKSTHVHIGLKKHSVKNARNGWEFRWENGKPLVLSDWSHNQTPPEPDGAGYEECVAWYPDGWRDVVCTIVIGAGHICEREADNATKQAQKGAEILPLWNEHVCPVPVSGFDEEEGPILATGNQCRPLLNVLWKHHEIRDIFNCSNGELISQFLLCDGVNHCQDGSDEKNCSTDCTEYQFHCTNRRCVSLAYFCDFWDDCGDKSDEENCVVTPCASVLSWQCNSGQCVPSEARCDLYFDCYDGSDENDCADKCEHDLCNDGTCIPSHWVMDGEVDCGGGRYEDELNIRGRTWKHICYRGRYREISYLFTTSRYSKERPNCTMVFDGFGKHYESFTTAGHECSGDNIVCPIGFYRCPSSYCIPIERVCDGVMDCIDGEEEAGCDNYECPGYYRCPGTSFCLYSSRICDGDVDCPGGKDEVMCDAKCPRNCSCFAGVVECSNIVIDNSIPFDHMARKIVVTDSQLLSPDAVFEQQHFVKEVILNRVGLSSLKNIFDDQKNLIKLNVSHNTIDTILSSALSNLMKLQILDLSYNPLTNISSNSFTGLRNLQELYMKYTSIEILEEGSFSALVSLKVLDITGKSVHVIADQAFRGLGHLSVLYMQGNTIANFGQQAFNGLETLEEFHTDMYSLCCSQVRPKSLLESKCISPKSSISSCEDLLANDFLRSSIWVLCIASLLGNLMSTVMRFVWERNSMKNGFGVFVTHLGISDFLMGVYLLIIAGADTMYKGTYIWHEFDWRQSHFCKLAGTLSVFSSEASTFFICLITLDRFLIIKFPFGQIKFRYKSATIIATLAWILAFIIAIVPLFPSLSHWNFYNKNGACLALPFSTERTPGWTYSLAIFTGLNFVAFIIIALGQLSIYRTMKQASLITSKERRAQEIAVARRLLLIVATDFLCWFPVGIMSVLALNGVSLDGAVYAWTAVFILPVNAALNPFLYTIPAVMQKIRNGQEMMSRQVTELSAVQPRVRIGDPNPSQVLLEDALRQLKTKQEKIQLMKDVCGGVIDCLVTRTSAQRQPNSIYLCMRGKVVDSVNLATRKNSSSVDLITAAMTWVNTQLDVQQKAGCDNDF